MPAKVDTGGTPVKVLNQAGLDLLLETLKNCGYSLIGPRTFDQAIIYDEIETTADLPIGLKDEQDGGSYRLTKRDDRALFGYAVGPHSWKKYLFPAAQRLYSVTRDGQALSFDPALKMAPKRAFIGVRACELAAIGVQDTVFLNGPFTDSGYQSRRENVFILAVNCTEPGHTCFCASMKTGPKAVKGFDLLLTEIVGPDRHDFMVETGSELGASVMQNVPGHDADKAVLGAVDDAMARSAARMGRVMDTREIKDLLYRHYEDRHWDEVARRCLSCGNCTLVCPTCFCSTVEDTTDLSGDHAERWRRWDSCFNSDFSYIHGGAIRPSIRSRYRQWMVHKLGTWIDQFGTSGCVGCGRCITWCPVGIDITQEAAALRAGETTSSKPSVGAAP